MLTWSSSCIYSCKTRIPWWARPVFPQWRNENKCIFVFIIPVPESCLPWSCWRKHFLKFFRIPSRCRRDSLQEWPRPHQEGWLHPCPMTPPIIAKLPPHPRVASQPLVPDPPPHRTYQVEGLSNSNPVHL